MQGKRVFSLEVSFNKKNKLIFNTIIRLSSLKSGEIICRKTKLVALKSLALRLSNISPEYVIDQQRFLSDLY